MMTDPVTLETFSGVERERMAAANAQHVSEHAARRAELAVGGEAVRRFGRSNVRLLVVPAAFPDSAPTRPTNAMHNILSEISRYYTEVSGGNVKLDYVLSSPIVLPQASSYYANGDAGRGSTEPNAKTLVRDALVAVSREITDFASFDADGDGRLDAFVVVHAGQPAETYGHPETLIWSHRGFRAGATAPSGVTVDEFFVVSEESPLGVWCHELGHLLFNWPDITEARPSGTVTHTWCLMSSGGWNGYWANGVVGSSPAHPCAPLKIRQGWVTSTNVTTNGSLDLPAIEGTAAALLLSSHSVDSTSLVLENRQRQMFDAGLAGSGLIVWDVQDTGPEPLIILVPATGSFDTFLRGTADDPFPGAKNVTSFQRYELAVSDISATSSMVRFTISGYPTTRRRAAGHT